METVYIETTIASYLVADPSQDILKAAKQQATRDWWQQRDRYLCVVSQEVLDEASEGNPEQGPAAAGGPGWAATAGDHREVRALAENFVATGAMPAKAARDAVHLAVATVFGADILLSWNCRHLVNRHILRRLEEVCRAAGVATAFRLHAARIAGRLSL